VKKQGQPYDKTVVKKQGQPYDKTMVKKQGQPYDNCVDTSQRIHDFDKNVYEELYPESYYSVLVITSRVLDVVTIVYRHQSATRKTDDVSHSKPRPVPHCRVLPTGEFNRIVIAQLL